MDIKKYKGKKTNKVQKRYMVGLNGEAYTAIKTVAVEYECTLSDSITKHSEAIKKHLKSAK